MFIHEVELLERIPSHMVDKILEFSKEESYPAQHLLFRQGDFAESLYLLEEGEVALTIRGERNIAFPVNESGSIFGWSALVEPRRYTASAEFTVASKIICIDGERMLRLLENHPQEGLLIMRRLAGVIAARLNKSYQKLIASSD